MPCSGLGCEIIVMDTFGSSPRWYPALRSLWPLPAEGLVTRWPRRTGSAGAAGFEWLASGGEPPPSGRLVIGSCDRGSSLAGAEGSCYIFEFTARSKMAGSAACSLSRHISVGRRFEEGTGCTATSLSGELVIVTDTGRFECTDMAVGVRRLMTQLT